MPSKTGRVRSTTRPLRFSRSEPSAGNTPGPDSNAIALAAACDSANVISVPEVVAMLVLRSIGQRAFEQSLGSRPLGLPADQLERRRALGCTVGGRPAGLRSGALVNGLERLCSVV